MKKILLPVDGSDNSIRAMEMARDLAELSGAKLTVLYVSDIGKYATTIYKAYHVEKFVEKGGEVLESIVEKLGDYKKEVEKLHLVGNAAGVIITTAEEEGFDLIVMGSRGLGAFSRALLGSVSNKVLNHSQVSVLIVK